MKLRHYKRMIKFSHVWMKYGLDEVLFVIPWFKPLKLFVKLNPFYWFIDRSKPYGDRLRLALEEMGPLCVKLGQMLSTRRDLLPDDIALALACLQDRVKPFAGAQAKEAVEAALGARTEKLFASFNSTPLASASIAQVHAAELFGGQDVVVKVLRPGIRSVIDSDIALMYTLAGLLERYWVRARRMRLLAIVQELENNLLAELDLFREGANASQLRRNFADTHILYIPEVYWDYCRHNILVTERIYGVPISHVDELKRQGVDMKLLAERAVEIFYTQVFRDCFFHADMHPGNIMVDTTNPSDPGYIGIDFGIVGSLSDNDKHYLAANFMAFFKRDYRRVAQLHIESGWVPPETRVIDFEAAIRTVCEPIFEKPLKDISYGHTLMRLFQIARRFRMEVQPQLILLQKTLLNIEGLGRELYPELDLWATAKPFLEKWMRHELGLRGLVRRFAREWPTISEQLPKMPALIGQALEQSKPMPGNSSQLKLPAKKRNKPSLAVVLGLALVIAAVAAWPPVWQWLDHLVIHWHSIIMGAAGVAILVYGWLRR